MWQISTSHCLVKRKQQLSHKVSTYRSHDCGLPVKHYEKQKVNVTTQVKVTGM